MNETKELSDLSAGLDRLATAAAAEPVGHTAIAVVLRDVSLGRLIESAAAQLELVASHLEFDELQTIDLTSYEMIVVEESLAIETRALLDIREAHGDGVNPALIAVRPASPAGAEELRNLVSLDGVLQLPLQASAISAQLGVLLYSHRAFVRRYQTALDELHLNRRIFRSVTSGISVANALEPDLPLVYVNPAFEVMTGYTLEAVQGKNCRFLQGEERDQAALPLLREAIVTGREVLVLLKNFRKDGTSFWNELSLSPIRNREGVVTHFVGIQSDVTARVEFEAALRESEKLAAVGRLASSIAHEINNPLESVMNLIYLAQQELPAADAATEGTRRYLALADRELQRVSSITAQSLRFYKQSTRPQAVDPAELVDSVLDLYESRTLNAGVTVERERQDAGRIVCLESEIRQVLSNLIRNAIDAMQGTGGRLLVRTRPSTDWAGGRAGVTLTIADTGAGISESTLKHLYKPFYTTKGIAGTGLGLWISREIVDRHDGRMELRSRQPVAKRKGSHGTVFRLFLPSQASL